MTSIHNENLRRIFLFFFLSTSLLVCELRAQQYSLSDVLRTTRENYQEQQNHYQKIGEGASKALWYKYIPQVSLNAQATHQSEVPELSLPALSILLPSIPKDQYQGYLEVRQLIWDGGRIGAGQKVAKAHTEVESAKLAISLREVEDRVRDVFFGILMTDRQIALETVLLEEYMRHEKSILASIEQGAAAQNDLDSFKIGRLGAEQKLLELKTTRHTLEEILLAYMGQEKTRGQDPITLLEPELPQGAVSNAVDQRAECILLDAQKKVNDSEWSQYRSAIMPTLALFGRGGYGKPGLNIFDPSARSYFIGGVTFSWDLGKAYEYKEQRTQWKNRNALIELKTRDLHRQLIALELQKKNELTKISNLIENDREIIQLRKSIRDRAKVQLTEGILSRQEFMQKETELNTAEQLIEIHRLQYLSASYSLLALYK